MFADGTLEINGDLPSDSDLSNAREIHLLRIPRGQRSLDFLAPVVGQLEGFRVPEGSRVRADFSVLADAVRAESLDLSGAVPSAEVDLSGLPRLRSFVLPPPQHRGHLVASALANPRLRALELQDLAQGDLSLVSAPLEHVRVWRSTAGITGVPASMPLGSLRSIHLFRMPAFDFAWIERAVALVEIEVWRVERLTGLRHLVERPRVSKVAFEDCPYVDEPELATHVNADRFWVIGETTIDRDAVDRTYPDLPRSEGEPLESFWSYGPFGNSVAMALVNRVEAATTSDEVSAIVDGALRPFALVDADRDTVRSSIAAAAVVAAAVGAVFDEPVTLHGALGTPLETTYRGPSRGGAVVWAPPEALIARASEVITSVVRANDPDMWANLLDDPDGCFYVNEALESSQTALLSALAGRRG